MAVPGLSHLHHPTACGKESNASTTRQKGKQRGNDTTQFPAGHTTVSDPSSSTQLSPGRVPQGRFRKGKKNIHPTQPQSNLHMAGEKQQQMGLSLALSFPAARPRLSGHRGDQAAPQPPDIASKQPTPASRGMYGLGSTPAPPTPRRQRSSSPSPPAPSHPASPLKKGIKSKTGIYFCEVSERLLLGAAVLGAPSGPPASLPAVVLRGLPGGLGLAVRGRPLKALGRDGGLVGHALPHDVPFPPQHHLLQGHSQGLSGLVRPSAETFCCPTQPRRLNQARCSTHTWQCSMLGIWVEISSLGSGHAEGIQGCSVLVPLIR